MCLIYLDACVMFADSEELAYHDMHDIDTESKTLEYYTRADCLICPKSELNMTIVIPVSVSESVSKCSI